MRYPKLVFEQSERSNQDYTFIWVFILFHELIKCTTMYLSYLDGLMPPVDSRNLKDDWLATFDECFDSHLNQRAQPSLQI